MKNKGFSLIELIIVIAIMAVLLSIVSPFFLNYLEKARVTVCRENRDRLKKDMYNELIAFDGKEKDASAYLDDYMSKAGHNKVDTNTYEGICSGKGVVTFEIDDIDSVDTMVIHAKCSIHGGDDVEIKKETVKKSNSTVYKTSYTKADSSVFTSNRGYTVNSRNFKDLSESEIAEQYPYLAGASMGYSSNPQQGTNSEYLYWQKDYVKELTNTEGSLIDNLIDDMCNDVDAYYASKNQAVNETKKDYIRNNSGNEIYVVTELQTPLGELYNKAVSGELPAGTQVQLKQYLYVRTKWSGEANNGSGGEAYVLYGERTVDAYTKKVSDANKSAMQGLLSKTEGNLDKNGNEWDSRNVLDIDTIKSTELNRTDNWTTVDSMAKPY